MSMDGGDEGFIEAQEESPEVAAPAGIAGGGDGGGGAEFCEVCAGAEVFALGGEDDDAHVGVVAGGFEGLVEGIAHVGVEGVMDVGAVESYVGDGAVFFVDDGLRGGCHLTALIEKSWGNESLCLGNRHQPSSCLVMQGKTR